MLLHLNIYVALRKESVDRNNDILRHLFNGRIVALRKESVDRNYYADKDCDWVRVSLSARRAWIEITDMSDAWHRFTSRSPQGERG